MNSKILKCISVLIIISILIVLYKTYNPSGNIYFPKCPFLVLTGLKCPGCGSQRAVHYILNFDIINAMKENLILVLSIPYIITGFVFDSIKNPNKIFLKWRKILFGRKAMLIILSAIIAFWIIRNLK